MSNKFLSADFTDSRGLRQARRGQGHKGSFGTQSERGARYVERILTACATCRVQGRSIIEYLRQACRCHLDGIAVPSLIKSAGNLAKSA